jgi:hypothetical protein
LKVENSKFKERFLNRLLLANSNEIDSPRSIAVKRASAKKALPTSKKLDDEFSHKRNISTATPDITDPRLNVIKKQSMHRITQSAIGINAEDQINLEE